MNEHNFESFDVTKIDSLESLKHCGDFLPLKNYIESEIGCKLGVRGWLDLYQKVKSVQLMVKSKKHYLQNVSSTQNLSQAKRELKKILGLRVAAASQSELAEKIALIVAFFLKPELSPYERYEKNKRRNFINSSRLEGLTIKPEVERKLLSQILDEYQEPVDG